MKYLKKLSLNEDKDKEFDKLYSIYLDRENLYNIIKDLMPDIPLLNDYNHGWIQTKKDNTGYFYFLSFKNPTYSKIKNTFKSDLYRMNQMMSDRFNISYTLTYRPEWWMSNEVKLVTKTFDNFSLMHSFLSTLNNNDIICELLIIFDDLTLNGTNHTNLFNIKESVDLKIDEESDLHDELKDIMIDLLETNYIQRESLKKYKTFDQYCYEIVFEKGTKISDILDVFKSSVYSVSGIMDGRYEVLYALTIAEVKSRKMFNMYEMTYDRQSFFHSKELFNFLEKRKDLFISSFDLKMNY